MDNIFGLARNTDLVHKACKIKSCDRGDGSSIPLTWRPRAQLFAAKRHVLQSRSQRPVLAT